MPDRYPERNARIVALREAGKLPHQIAPLIGVTRNTVIGVLNRHGRCTPGFHVGLAGEAHPNAKLTWDAVRAIRASYRKNHAQYSAGAIASRYGVDRSLIRKIVRNEMWREPQPAEAAA